jgi:lysine 2,3-aminomutase
MTNSLNNIEINSTRSIKQLEKYVSFAPQEKLELDKLIDSHPMSVNPYYLELIDWDDPDDPIRKMAVPTLQERSLEGSFDTSGEQDDTRLRGLQHKYPQTALVLCTNNCAMYCRYCFRKRLVGVALDEIAQDWSGIVKYITEHKEITNVLLSGGDPLTLKTDRVATMLDHLSGIDHLRYIRIGTRTPVVCPSRIVEDDKLAATLKECIDREKRIYITTQFNHPRELTSTSNEAISRLLDAHVIVNNQTVLLKGVNDDPVVMADLQSSLTEIGVIPYYVFQCRPVKKVMSIFQVPLHRAVEIVEATKARLDGLGKRFRFVMSHETGKIEILGCIDDQLYFQYHQSKDPRLSGKLFHRKLSRDAGWL